MAIFKSATTPTDATGREGGAVLYLTGARLVGRRVIVPVDVAAADQLQLRQSLSQASKTFGNRLTGPEQASWDTASRYTGRGNLEITAVSAAATQASQPRPTTRSAATTQAPPGFAALAYRPSPFLLQAAVSPGALGAGATLTYVATPPAAAGSRPSRARERTIATVPATTGLVTLTSAYLATFAGVALAGEEVTLKINSYDPVLPANSNALLVTTEPTTVTPFARVRLGENPIPRNGSRSVIIFAVFSTVPIGDPLTLTVQSGPYVWTPPASVLNGIEASGTLADVDGRARQAAATWTFATALGDTRSITLSPDIGQ